MSDGDAGHSRRGEAGSISRRAALLGAGAATAAAAGCGAALETPPPGAPPPFAHGVASGDPLQTAVVLWTRVTASEPGPVETAWTIARDEALSDVVARGTAVAQAARDHTVKVDVTRLEPDTAYFYAFDALGARSPVGRTRTLPEGATETFNLAVVSCANHPAGWFNVYRDIAERGEADVVLHLGDYFYEYAPGEYATDWGASRGRVPDPPHETVTLADYRRRHAQYKADPDLQAAHAAAPWIVAWDDHESANNAYASGAENHQADEGDWTARKLAAARAYYEWMPIRDPAPGASPFNAWRTFEIGDLASLVMLETRLTARSPEITWEAAPIDTTADMESPETRATLETFLTGVVGAPDRQMLGPTQLEAVAAALAASQAAGKPWRLLGNQTIMSPMRSPNLMRKLPFWLRWAVRFQYPEEFRLLQLSPLGIPLSLDQWDGYPAERERLYAAAREAGAQLITLTGDSHCFFVNRLNDAEGRRRGVEIGASSVTSPSEYNQIPAPGVDFGRLVEEANPHILHHNGYDRGYVSLTLTPKAAVAELRRVDTVARRDFRVEPYARWEIAPNPEGELDAVRV